MRFSGSLLSGCYLGSHEHTNYWGFCPRVIGCDSRRRRGRKAALGTAFHHRLDGEARHKIEPWVLLTRGCLPKPVLAQQHQIQRGLWPKPRHQGPIGPFYSASSSLFTPGCGF